MTQQTFDPRELVLDGCANFRDLGGLATRDGRTVRRGVVFRSDALHALTAIDLDRLVALRIATLIDLRTVNEIEQSGPSPLTGRGARVLHVPVTEQTGAPERIDPSLRMDHVYAEMLIRGQACFGTLFSALAEEATLPAVIHCAAGKDRTGITVALLLRVLGVPDETIVHDYTITDRNMTRVIERIRRTTPERLGDIPAPLFRAAPETMTAFLVSLDTTYGSAEAYLGNCGVADGHIAALRQRLLTTQSN